MAVNETKARTYVEYLFKNVEYPLARVAVFGLTERQLRSRYMRMAQTKLYSGANIFNKYDDWKLSRYVNDCPVAALYLKSVEKYIAENDVNFVFNASHIKRYGFSVESGYRFITSCVLIDFKRMATETSESVKTLVVAFIKYLMKIDANFTALRNKLKDFNDESIDNCVYDKAILGKHKDNEEVSRCFDLVARTARVLSKYTGQMAFSYKSLNAFPAFLYNPNLWSFVSTIQESNSTEFCDKSNEIVRGSDDWFFKDDVHFHLVEYFYTGMEISSSFYTYFDTFETEEVLKILQDLAYFNYLIAIITDGYYHEVNGYTEYAVIAHIYGGDEVISDLYNYVSKNNPTLIQVINDFKAECNKLNSTIMDANYMRNNFETNKERIDYVNEVMNGIVAKVENGDIVIGEEPVLYGDTVANISDDSIPITEDKFVIELVVSFYIDHHEELNGHPIEVVADEIARYANKSIKGTNIKLTGAQVITILKKERIFDDAETATKGKNKVKVSRGTKTESVQPVNATEAVKVVTETEVVKVTDEEVTETEVVKVVTEAIEGTAESEPVSAVNTPDVENSVENVENERTTIKEKEVVDTMATDTFNIFAEHSCDWTLPELVYILSFDSANVDFDTYVTELRCHSYFECKRKYKELQDNDINDVASLFAYCKNRK